MAGKSRIACVAGVWKGGEGEFWERELARVVEIVTSFVVIGLTANLWPSLLACSSLQCKEVTTYDIFSDSGCVD